MRIYSDAAVGQELRPSASSIIEANGAGVKCRLHTCRTDAAFLPALPTIRQKFSVGNFPAKRAERFPRNCGITNHNAAKHETTIRDRRHSAGLPADRAEPAACGGVAMSGRHGLPRQLSNAARSCRTCPAKQIGSGTVCAVFPRPCSCAAYAFKPCGLLHGPALRSARVRAARHDAEAGPSTAGLYSGIACR